MRPIQVMPACRHLVDQGSNDLRPDTALPVLRENHEILDITIGNTIGNDAAHTNGPAGLCIGRDSKGKTAPDEMAEIFGFIFLLPPSPGPIESSYLFFVPRMDNLHRDIICHKQSYPVLLFKRFPDTHAGRSQTSRRLIGTAEKDTLTGFPGA